MSEFPDIPGYRLQRELGRGGMASVYLATQESLDREVALKVMATALAADGNFTERFLREARTVAKLQHPAIVPVYDMGVSGNLHFLAMEYVSGGDLKRRLRTSPMPPAEALRVLRQIAEALDYAHGKGFVHRDVKPENILFRDNGSAVLSDFGIARAMRSTTRMTGTGMSLGTPHYMSPEQARGMDLDGRSDLYSLGVVLHEMLTGELPYVAQDSLAVVYRHVNDPIPQLPAGLAALQPLLERMMAKDPGARYQTGQEITAALDSGPTVVHRARVGVAAQGGRRRRLYGWAAVGMLTFAAFALAIGFATDWRPDFGATAASEPSAGTPPAGSSSAVATSSPVNGVSSLAACPALKAQIEQAQRHLGEGDLFATVRQLRTSAAGDVAIGQCREVEDYQSLLLVAGARIVKELQDVERLESVLTQALQKAEDDLQQLQRLSQLARLSGDGIGAAEASVAIENSEASLSNMKERAERVSQRGDNLNQAGAWLSSLIDEHGTWARNDPKRAYQRVASQVGMESMERQLTIFLVSDQDSWKVSDSNPEAERGRMQ